MKRSAKPQPRSGISKVNSVCKSVLKLTDDDIAQAEQMAQEQSNYVHPLKGAKQRRLNTLGEGNLRIIRYLKTFREAVIVNAP